MSGIVFLNQRAIGIVGGCIVAMLAGAFAFRLVRRRQALLRVPIRLTSALVVVCCFLIIGMVGCVSLFTTSSRPIYSPDHRHALLVVDSDEGALGGSTGVELYSDHGLHSDWVYQGQWKTVQAGDVRWMSNSEIVLSHRMYTADDVPELCAGARGIRIRCIAISPAGK
jgi:hypothetical protein